MTSRWFCYVNFGSDFDDILQWKQKLKKNVSKSGFKVLQKKNVKKMLVIFEFIFTTYKIIISLKLNQKTIKF